MIVKIGLVNSIDEARKLNNLPFYITEENAKKLRFSTGLLHEEIIGFIIVDNNLGEIGIVNEIIDYPNHSVIQAFQNKKEILIPYDPAIVLEIDPKKKQVIVDLPDGLLEVNS